MKVQGGKEYSIVKEMIGKSYLAMKPPVYYLYCARYADACMSPCLRHI